MRYPCRHTHTSTDNVEAHRGVVMYGAHRAVTGNRIAVKLSIRLAVVVEVIAGTRPRRDANDYDGVDDSRNWMRALCRSDHMIYL